MYIVDIKENEIKYFLTKGYVCIENDNELKRMLKNKNRYSDLANCFIKMYCDIYGTSYFNKKDFILEVYLHVLIDKIFSSKLLRKTKLSKSLLRHTAVIDIGENDKERRVLNKIGKILK